MESGSRGERAEGRTGGKMQSEDKGERKMEGEDKQHRTAEQEEIRGHLTVLNSTKLQTSRCEVASAYSRRWTQGLCSCLTKKVHDKTSYPTHLTISNSPSQKSKVCAVRDGFPSAYKEEKETHLFHCRVVRPTVQIRVQWPGRLLGESRAQATHNPRTQFFGFVFARRA